MEVSLLSLPVSFKLMTASWTCGNIKQVVISTIKLLQTSVNLLANISIYFNTDLKISIFFFSYSVTMFVTYLKFKKSLHFKWFYFSHLQSILLQIREFPVNLQCSLAQILIILSFFYGQFPTFKFITYFSTFNFIILPFIFLYLIYIMFAIFQY